MDNHIENLRKKVEQLERRLLALEMTQETGLVSDAHSVGATVNDPTEGAYVELAE